MGVSMMKAIMVLTLLCEINCVDTEDNTNILLKKHGAELKSDTAVNSCNYCFAAFGTNTSTNSF